MTVPLTRSGHGSIIEDILVKGDLSKLTEEQRTTYYFKVCESLGLNPYTRPFDYLPLQGKLVFYAKRDAADQLRKNNGISIQVVSRDVTDDVLTVHVKARTQDGREDEDLGSVPFPATLRGELRANAILKAVTKAKRRVTLSICGLGFLDETEIDDIPAVRAAPRARPNVMLDDPDPNDPPHGFPGTAVESPAPVVHTDTAGAEAPDADGVIQETDSERIKRLDYELAGASEKGWATLKARWETIADDDAAVLNAAMKNRHKPRALEVERARKEQP